MSRLRERLIAVHEEETLKKVLVDKYDTATPKEKEHLLSFLGDTIQRDVDKLIREEIDDYNENTPTKKKNKKMQILLIIIEVILTILIGFAVNDKSWGFVTGIGLAMIIVLILPLILED
jgi:fatty-acid desaturase